jgi:hypothetical protein
MQLSFQNRGKKSLTKKNSQLEQKNSKNPKMPK